MTVGGWGQNLARATALPNCVGSALESPTPHAAGSARLIVGFDDHAVLDLEEGRGCLGSAIGGHFEAAGAGRRQALAVSRNELQLDLVGARLERHESFPVR